MNVSAVVMAHPSRRAWAEDLAGRLDCPTVYDDGDGLWATARRALAAHDHDGDWHLVVQDDAILPDRFEQALAEALPHADGRPVCLCVQDATWRSGLLEACRRAHAVGAGWVASTGPHSGVAVAHPTRLLPDVLDLADRESVDSYDTRTMRAYRALGVDCLYTVPCLAGHRDGPSIHTPGKPARRAWRVLDGETPDWTADPIRVD